MSGVTPVIGLLDLQGAVREHKAVLDRLGIPSRPVRLPDELRQVDALIIPGGESTTIGKLMVRRGLDTAITEAASAGMPIYGTCAGLILMAARIEESDQYRLGLLDVEVRRNAFGRQIDSFEADIPIPDLGETPLRGVFIRAPLVTQIGQSVEVLGLWNDNIVAVRERSLLGTSFHPELTEDHRFHDLLVRMAAEWKSTRR
jgi:pyridoxal 5'-phosphate synthase pdxT subunit